MKPILSILFVFLSLSLSAQQIQRSTLGNGGSSTEISNSDHNYYVSQSVGQSSVTGTLINGKSVIRQGFQQPPIKVEIISEDTSDIQATIFPNPVEANITIQFNEELKKPINVVIYDVLGKQIVNTSEKPTRFFHLNLSHLATGTYLLNIISGNRAFTARLIKK